MILSKEQNSLKGQATIEIKKEWVECQRCKGDYVLSYTLDEEGRQTDPIFCDCNKGKISKYEVGDEIEIRPNCSQCSKTPIKSIQHSASPNIRYCCLNKKCANFGICYKFYNQKS